MKNSKYSPSEIEAKWQRIWEEKKIYSPNLDKAKKPFYNLMMFPYPSAEGLHVGNVYAFAGADVFGRFMRMKGNDVFEPIGLDGFGIHSENYALKVGKHPSEQAKISEVNFYRQLRSIGNGFDWTRTVETYDPEYYKWTQWIFIQMFKAGLAYRAKAEVNWCPSDKTVLADEQVIDGRCERDGAVVEKRELEQWFFKITDYAERLLANIPKLNWSEKVKVAQENWIGRSEGTLIRFRIKDLGLKNKEKNHQSSIINHQSNESVDEFIEVFTTKPETCDGATFLVLAPEHPIVDSLLKGEPEAARSDLAKLKSYVEGAKKKTEQDLPAQAGRIVEGRGKTGVFSGLYAINPVNGKEIPVWIADYVVMGYGTGAIMAVPFADERDKEFAEAFNLPIVKTSFAAKPKGRKIVSYHLRDWLISRQRYWGPPIPMVFCGTCAAKGIKSSKSITGIKGKGMAGWFPVSEADLPVLLPDVADWKPKGTGKSPLASIESFIDAKCPNCGGEARRETDVSDTFLDSAWYFFRYTSTDVENKVFDTERVKKWLPVNMYIGGAEHSVLHLLYSRFITMFLKDQDLIEFEEPFSRFYAHGLIIKDGAKMSKSKGNVVVPDQYIKKYGVDTLRCYLMFIGPYNQGGDFQDTGIEGMSRFLNRVWKLISEHSENSVNQTIRKSDASDNQKLGLRVMHKTIKKVTEDMENLRYNTAIASLMEWYNYLNKQLTIDKGQLTREEAEAFLKLLAPFAPHMTEELYQRLMIKDEGLTKRENHQSVHLGAWPSYDPKYLQEEEITLVVQVNGKVRDSIKVKSNLPAQAGKLKVKSEVQEAAKTEKVKKYLEGKEIKNIIYVEGKIINFVTS